MGGRRILIFGGTAEAREFAALLAGRGYHTVTSLAGVTAQPHMPEGGVVRGGFGGAAGIAAYVARENIAAIVDATHPFALRISRHVHSAAIELRIPYLRLERPAWVSEPGDDWREVAGIAQAVAAIPANARVMLTVGRKEAASFLVRQDLKGIVRMIEAPLCDIPEGWTLIRARPPFTTESEAALIDRHRLDVLVSKNSGGGETRAKLIAARERNIPVVMVARPLKPEAPSYAEPGQAATALNSLLNS